MRTLRLLLPVAIIWGLATTVEAQPYPTKPIKLVSPFPAGGPNDAAARIAARAIQMKVRQSVVVENVAGAGGTIGARNVANAPPDGYTLLLISVATNYGIHPALYKLDYDPLKTLAPVASFMIDKQIMVASPKAPFKDLKELVAYAKANPGKLNYGAPIGIGPHFLMEMFKIQSGTNIVHVPYRGSGPAAVDAVGGQIHLMAAGKSLLLPLVQSGKLRAIAVGSTRRWPELPDVPTLIEAGYEDAIYDTNYGIGAPMGTPNSIIETLNAAINEGLRNKDVRDSLDALGVEPMAMSVADYKALVAKEAKRWTEVVRLTGIRAAPQ